MARLIRMDDTGHTTLAEWTAAVERQIVHLPRATLALRHDRVEPGVELLPERGHGSFDRFARDEAGGETASEPVPPNDAEQPWLLAEPQETGAEHRRQWSGIGDQG